MSRIDFENVSIVQIHPGVLKAVQSSSTELFCQSVPPPLWPSTVRPLEVLAVAADNSQPCSLTVLHTTQRLYQNCCKPLIRNTY